MKPFLILQLRPETEASDNEFEAFLEKGKLGADEVLRMRLDEIEPPADIDLRAFSGVIVGGGPGCVSDPPDRKSTKDLRMENAVMALMPQIVAQDLPFLGCCYGIGILTSFLGGNVSKAHYGEAVGTSRCVVKPAGRDDPLTRDLPDAFDAFVGHKEAVQALPPGCAHLLSSQACPYQMIRHGQNVYATQFHPEADADGFEVRIRIYKDAGYFAPEAAAELIEMCRNADVHAPERILAAFVQRYRR